MTYITDVIDNRANGEPVTVLDRAAETLRTGGFLNDAAARCGVHISQLREWLTIGNRATADIVQGRRTNSELTDRERDCVRLAAALEYAETEGKMMLLNLSTRVALGGAKVETVTTSVTDAVPALYEPKDPDDPESPLRLVRPEIPARRTVVEKHETTQPDGQMIRWRLERRWPDQYGRSTRLELTGPEGGPVQIDMAPVDALLGFLDNLSAQRAASHEVISTGAREVGPGSSPGDPQAATEGAEDAS